MIKNMIDKFIEVNDYPDHRIDGVFSCKYNNRIYCRFKIPLIDGGFAYMDQAISNTSSGEIVIADSQRFLSAWHNNSNSIVPELSRGDKTAWRLDSKFQDAENGFSLGACNPVPLAELHCFFILERGLPIPSVSFTNGITRTIWLLYNDVDRFPVYAYDHRSSELLQRGIGHRSALPLASSDIFFRYAESVLPKHLRYKAKKT
ncbi:hypothetical protein AAH678_27955 [Sodalis endosymbiont of Spalangia cameroni]|uniref:plasmid fertility inhibition factor family protein n=1 Tax=Sodalis praecaptivus TaxID=1239307 RepID=UPI0031F9E5C3